MLLNNNEYKFKLFPFSAFKSAATSNLQMLEKKFMLPNINYKNANPAIPLNDWNMKVLPATKPWPRNKKYISVSNYGFGGTNAHAVLEMAPQEKKATASERSLLY